jgi:hypothetical protein
VLQVIAHCDLEGIAYAGVSLTYDYQADLELTPVSDDSWARILVVNQHANARLLAIGIARGIGDCQIVRDRLSSRPRSVHVSVRVEARGPTVAAGGTIGAGLLLLEDGGGTET